VGLAAGALITLSLYPDEPGRQGGSGLGKSDLKKASATVRAQWQELDPWGISTSPTSQGSAGVFDYVDDGDRLLLFTNKHVLNLASLSESDTFGHPDVKSYRIQVIFPGGQKRRVKRFGALPSLDLALLEVKKGDLKEGRDFVVLPWIEEPRPEAGDKVVAVGTPRGLVKTQTFGHISAIRSFRRARYIQTDAALNPGNSGGPLFRRIDREWYLAGVNTFGVGREGLNMAISSREIVSHFGDFQWYSCDKTGAAKAVREIYKAGARAEE
jgi:S1-C subfamily serine protease